MYKIFKLSITLLALFLVGCLGNCDNGDSTYIDIDKSDSTITDVLEFSITGNHAEDDSTLLRVAFIGDGEPKPCALFPHTDAAIEQMNTLI